jgi:uncharacterized membrane protein
MKKQQITSALRISLIYTFIGGLWILLSDQVTAILFTNPEQFSIAQTYKGWLYVIITTFILFILTAIPNLKLDYGGSEAISKPSCMKVNKSSQESKSM